MDMKNMENMDLKNCWDFKKCGREIGGINVKTLGVCPAATFEPSHGFLEGENGGRACMYITGTFCSGIIQGTFVEKVKNCVKCDFYKKLKRSFPIGSNVLQFHKYVRKNTVPEIAVATA